MRAAWVAGAIRGEALARRGLGARALQELADQPSLPAALHLLGESTYGHRLQADMDLEAAQRAVADTALWHLRVLAGWLPPAGVGLVRAFSGWFEVQNLEALAVALASGRRRPQHTYTLGALATVWSRAAEVSSLEGLRALLAHSEWGDPGGTALPDILLGLRLAWARSFLRALPERSGWGLGTLAVSVAAARFLAVTPARLSGWKEVPELGRGWSDAPDVAAFVRRLPGDARWPFAGVADAGELWQAERGWWLRVGADAAELLHGTFPGRSVVVGAAATLLTDSWGVRTALAVASRGRPAGEAVHAAA